MSLDCELNSFQLYQSVITKFKIHLSFVIATGDLTRAFETLLTTIRNLASDDSYKTITGIFDEVPRLNALVELKDTELSDLRREITEVKSRHKHRLQEDLELYRTQRNKLEEEKSTLADKISTLEVTVEQKNAASAEHIRTQNALTGKLDQVTQLLEAEKEKIAAINTDITKLHQSIKGKDVGIDKLKDSLRNEKTQNSKAATTIQDLKKKIESLQKNLDSSTTRLNEIERFTTRLQKSDDAVWIEQLNEVWKTACNVVTSLFVEDITVERLEDKSAWKDLRESRYLNHTIPLPRSNSPEAKQMRVAALLAILGRSISQHIFQPTYISEEGEEIRELLVLQAISDSKKESFCRASLLSIFPEDQEKNLAKAMDQVIREVSWCVRNLVAEAQYESFRSGVQYIVRKARGAWQLVQNTREKFEPYFELDRFVDLEWRALNLNDGHVSIGQDSTVRAEDDEALLLIFPRIHLIADSAPDPVTPGVVLMKSQSMLAAKEMERANPSSPTTGRAGPRSRAIRSRTMSTSVNGTGTFLSQPNPLVQPTPPSGK